MKPLVVIGDVHGKLTCPGPNLRNLLRQINANTVQLGDYGVFNGQDIRTLRKVKPQEGYWHRAFRGNHDNPELFNAQSFSLGDFGVLPEYPDIMFFAGAESCDKEFRVEGKSWWANEQLSDDQMQEAADLYGKIKPRIVLSHECPTRCYAAFHFDGFNAAKASQNRTARFLDNLLHIHKPERLFHGHHHIPKTYEMDGVIFRSVGELEAVEVPV